MLFVRFIREDCGAAITCDEREVSCMPCSVILGERCSPEPQSRFTGAKESTGDFEVLTHVQQPRQIPATQSRLNTAPMRESYTRIKQEYTLDAYKYARWHMDISRLICTLTYPAKTCKYTQSGTNFSNHLRKHPSNTVWHIDAGGRV